MGQYNYLILLTSFWLFVLYFNYKQIRYAYTLQNKGERNLIVGLQPILLAGILVRAVFMSYPYGVFCDETINGYDAWSIAHYGVDQHLSSYPVYLKSWGSGQSALYAYLAAPFIKLFGLSTAVHRLPMALVSCGAILFFYHTLRKTQKNTLLLFIVTAFLSINPWHIMKSRWALDCNICPDLILIGICFIVLAYYASAQKRRRIYYPAGFALIAIAAYGYGVSWLMLPVFCILLFAYLVRKKAISYPQAIACVIITGLIVLPLILFAFNIFFDGEQYRIGAVTITQLAHNRHDTTFLLGSDNLLPDLAANIRSGGFLWVWGSDGLAWNSIRIWGQFYNIVTFPFILFYFYRIVRYKNFSFVDIVFIAWAISCIPIVLFVQSNVNHWNLLWFPLAYFGGCGIYFFISRFRKAFAFTGIIYLAAFSMFLYEYFDYYHLRNKGTLWFYEFLNEEIEEPVKTLSEIKGLDRIYYPGEEDGGNSLICYVVLYHHPADPYSIRREPGSKGGIVSFGNNYFNLPKQISPDRKTAYVIPNSRLSGIDTTGFNISAGREYTVLWNE